MAIPWRFVKNAVANLGRGSAAALVAILLPPVLVRHMPAASYAVWVLVLQIAAYVGYLDFGLQTAVGRYVAFANEKNDPIGRDGIFSTAFAGLSTAALVGLVLISLLSVASHRIFPSVPPVLASSMRLAILIVGVSVAIGLPASAWNGVFVGLQRFEVPALTTSTGKALSAVGLVVAAICGASLVWMAVIVAGCNIFSYCLQYVMLRRMAPEVAFRRELISRSLIGEVTGYSFSLTVWSFAMLLISGFDLLLVGRFQFNAVTPYSVSAALITILVGIQNAIFGVIMPHAAQLQARHNLEALGRLLVKTTRFGVLLLLLTGLPLIAFAQGVIRLWIGPQYARDGGIILIVLVIANMVRLTCTPFASILIGTGQQRIVIISPLIEGITNLAFSILLGMRYGAIGVAWGTLIGAATGVMANICYNLPRVQDSIQCSPTRYLFEAIAEPALCGIPILLAIPATMVFESIGSELIAPAWLVSFCACAIVMFRTGFKDFESESEQAP